MAYQTEGEQTYDALKVILNDEETFHHVCSEVFANIDVNRDGTLEKAEIRKFIDNICLEMGMEDVIDDETMNDVFGELDEDGSEDIDLDEMKAFLKQIFINQKEELGKALSK